MTLGIGNASAEEVRYNLTGYCKSTHSLCYSNQVLETNLQEEREERDIRCTTLCGDGNFEVSDSKVESNTSTKQEKLYFNGYCTNSAGIIDTSRKCFSASFSGDISSFNEQYNTNCKNMCGEGRYTSKTESVIINNGSSGTTTPETNPSPTKSDVPGAVNFCYRSASIMQIIGYVLFVVKIVVPLVIIVLASIDMTKAVTAGDDKAIKEQGIKLLKRLILGISIFLLPTIVRIVFNTIGNFTGEMKKDYNMCVYCLTKPGECDTSFKGGVFNK